MCLCFFFVINEWGLDIKAIGATRMNLGGGGKKDGDGDGEGGARRGRAVGRKGEMVIFAGK